MKLTVTTTVATPVASAVTSSAVTTSAVTTSAVASSSAVVVVVSAAVAVAQRNRITASISLHNNHGLIVISQQLMILDTVTLG